MSPMLRPLRLPQLVEERRRRESMKTDYEFEQPSYSFYTFSSTSSELTSPVTPTFSARGHVRHSSSASSFDFALPSTPEYPPSPTRRTDIPSKWTLADVQEESPSYEYADAEDYIDIDDASSDQFDLSDCLRDEPRICQAPTMDFLYGPEVYDTCEDFDYDFGSQQETDMFKDSTRSSRTLRQSLEAPFSGLSSRISSKLPSLTTRRSTKPFSVPGSPVSESNLERYSRMSRGFSSRSSSRSAAGRYQYDRTNEPPLPPTPDLSLYGSSESVAKRASSVLEEVEEKQPSLEASETIQRDRAMATTPLLPPFMNGIAAPPTTAIGSPLASPLASPTISLATTSVQSAPQSPLMPPPLSSKPSLSSFPSIMASTELAAIPEPDAWSDLLGHANFTISPAPYSPDLSSPDALQKYQEDWDGARINYARHLARTGEHYGDTSKTFALTQAKWTQIEHTWTTLHKQAIAGLIARGAFIADYTKADEVVPTTLPHMAEGKFPDRGDQDIVGPMFRQATMSPTSDASKRPSFWKRMTGR